MSNVAIERREPISHTDVDGGAKAVAILLVLDELAEVFNDPDVGEVNKLRLSSPSRFTHPLNAELAFFCLQIEALIVDF